MFDRYYGLAANPFQLTPDARFYFESATHRKALSYLGYGLAQGEGFIVITGEIGSGKTTLVGHLMSTIDRSRLTAASIVTSALDAHDMVEMAAESFGIDTRGRDKAAVLKAIEEFLHDEARAGRRCLLIVDEAQNLSIGALEELRMLSNFQLGGQALLQTFLLGQPEFRDRVQGEPRLEQLRQRVIASHHLGAMEREEVEAYIVHRLGKVGWDGRPDITPEAIDRLYGETGGMPRKLNSLLSRLLLMGAVEETDMLDLPMLERVIADRDGQASEEDVVPDQADPEPVAAEIESHPEPEPEPEPEQVSEQEPAGEYTLDHDMMEPDMIEAEHIEPESEIVETVEAEIEPEVEAAPAQSEDPAYAERLSAYVGEGIERGRERDAMAFADDDGVFAALAADLAAVRSRCEELEKRLGSQEDAIKQVLSMLIDWAEHGAPFERSRAA